MIVVQFNYSGSMRPVVIHHRMFWDFNPSKHESILKIFSSGDADERDNLFEIYCKANDRNAATY